MEQKSLDEQFLTFKNDLEHLCKVRQPVVICDEDDSCYEAILRLKSLIENDEMFSNNETRWSFLLKKNYEILFIDILYHLSKRCQKFRTDLNEKPILILDFLLEIVYRLTEFQLKIEHLLDFSIKLHTKGLCEVLLTFFKRDKYLNKAWTNYDPHKRIINIMSILLNISENPYLRWTDEKKLDFEVTLIGFASPHVKAYADLSEKILKNVNHLGLVEFLSYLTNLNDLVKIGESEKVYNDLFFIRYKIKSHEFNEENLFLTSKFLDLLVNFLDYVNQELIESIDFDFIDIEIKKPRHTPSNLKQRLYSIFFNIMVILNEIMFRSNKALSYFTEIRMIESLARFLTDSYIKKLQNKHEKLILVLIQNLALMCGWPGSEDQVSKYEWNHMNIFRTISSITHVYETSLNNKIVLNCAYVIANILENENDLENLEKLVKLVCLDLNDFVNDLVALNNTKQRGSGTLFCVYKFSIHSRAKKIIYDESYEALKKFVEYGDAREHLYALKTLTQLGFVQNLAVKMNEDKLFIKILKNLTYEGETQEVKNLSEILLFLLKGKQKPSQNPNKPPSVYISFSISQSKMLVKKISARLDIKGIKVKNVEFIQNDFAEFDREKAQKLILKSEHVLVCISERYRMSPRCQAEALIALDAGKHIIALIVQEGFESNEMRSGWLEALASKKDDLINFWDMKHFENSMETLINLLLGQPSELVIKKKHIEQWTSFHVHEWLLKNEINVHICELYKNVNGLTLKEIHAINVENPKFFYECIKKETNFKVDKVDYEIFSQKLRNLFSEISLKK